jgi:hypothetical protein
MVPIALGSALRDADERPITGLLSPGTKRSGDASEIRGADGGDARYSCRRSSRLDVRTSGESSERKGRSAFGSIASGERII